MNQNCLISEKYHSDIRECQKIAFERELLKKSDNKAIFLDDGLDKITESIKNDKVRPFLSNISNDSILMITIVMDVGKNHENYEENELEEVYQQTYNLFHNDKHLREYVASKLPLGTYLKKGMQLFNIKE